MAQGMVLPWGKWAQGHEIPKKGSQIAASAPPERVLAVAAAAGDTVVLWEHCVPPAQGWVGLDGGCLTGGASAWLQKVLLHPQPSPGTKMGLSEQELGTSKGNFSELCRFRVSFPKSLIPRHIPTSVSSPALTMGQI